LYSSYSSLAGMRLTRLNGENWIDGDSFEPFSSSSGGVLAWIWLPPGEYFDFLRSKEREPWLPAPARLRLALLE
jgi:hypothetical protein